MKNFTSQLFFTIAFLFTTQLMFGQILYGLQKPNGNINAPFDVVSIDPSTAVSTTLFSTNSLSAVAAGATAYDQQNERYICWGYTTNNDQRLFVADIDSGVVVSQPIISGQPIEMEYDLNKQTNYGLWYDQSQSMQYFVSIDLNTGALNNIAALPTVSAVAIGNSTFDSNLARYIFIGIENNQQKLITIDAGSGNILYSTPINQNQVDIGGLEYDVTANKLFGLHNQIDSSIYDPASGAYSRDVYFAEVDLMTGAITVINTTPVNQGLYSGYILGGIAFDQQSQSYIAMVSGTSGNNNGFFLKMINATTGQVTSETYLGFSSTFIEIQCDNYSFAKSFYINTKTTKEPTITGKIFPNPASNWLNVDIEGAIVELNIYNVNGQLVQSIQQLQGNRINVSQLENGVYFLEIRTQDGILRKSFLK
jgi:hypothetical protein